ncbi:LysE family transporter [Fulvimarina sp. MAC8]|uniref:LysE family translocator n=1 Tax=Fulvimarina sp. MAC8 TaxID=3162874 RepID=UPI0032ED8DE3
MNHLLVLLPIFAVFIPALMTPGPDFVTVVRASMSRGARAGILTTMGVSIGLIFYASLSLCGLAAFMAEYVWATWLVRVIGGAYLIYLGIKLCFAQPKAIDLAEATQPPRGRTLVFGLLGTLTNPKAIILFSSVFATGVSATTPLWLLCFMVALVGFSAFSWYCLVSLFMASAPVVRRFEKTKHWIERLAGASFVALGGKVLMDARSPVNP